MTSPEPAVDVDAVNALATEIVQACTLEEGQLLLLEPAFLSLGRRLHESSDKPTWATALIAVATQLKDIAGTSHAAGQCQILAAIALGDIELNGMLCRKLYGRPH